MILSRQDRARFFECDRQLSDLIALPGIESLRWRDTVFELRRLLFEPPHAANQAAREHERREQSTEQSQSDRGQRREPQTTLVRLRRLDPLLKEFVLPRETGSDARQHVRRHARMIDQFLRRRGVIGLVSGVEIVQRLQSIQTLVHDGTQFSERVRPMTPVLFSVNEFLVYLVERRINIRPDLRPGLQALFSSRERKVADARFGGDEADVELLVLRARIHSADDPALRIFLGSFQAVNQNNGCDQRDHRQRNHREPFHPQRKIGPEFLRRHTHGFLYVVNRSYRAAALGPA